MAKPKDCGVSDPDQAALHKAQLEASVVIATLRDAGDITFNPVLKSVTFEWRRVRDALAVYEAITGKLP